MAAKSVAVATQELVFKAQGRQGRGGGCTSNQEGCEEPLLTHLPGQDLGGHIARGEHEGTGGRAGCSL